MLVSADMKINVWKGWYRGNDTEDFVEVSICNLYEFLLTNKCNYNFGKIIIILLTVFDINGKVNMQQGINILTKVL